MHEGSHEVAQKAFAIADMQQKSHMLHIIDGSIAFLMQHEYGCMFLQQVLYTTRNLPEDAEGREEFLKRVVGAFQSYLLTKNNICECSCHRYGNYVVAMWLKLLQKLPASFVIQGHQPFAKFEEEVLSNIVTIGRNILGCRIILRLLEHERASARLFQKLLEISTLESLMPTDGGNYVVQGILDHGSTADKVQLLSHMYEFNNFLYYANDTYARHVVQKSFDRYPEPEVRAAQSQQLALVLKPNGRLKPVYQRLLRNSVKY